MTKFLLTLHVLAAILAVGPVTVAASMFPPAARRVPAADGAVEVGTVRLLHRICRAYAAFGVSVPVLGLATARVECPIVRTRSVIALALHRRKG
ncbi:hypothetical protein ACWDRX_28640, partial [Streptomyces nigra]